MQISLSVSENTCVSLHPVAEILSPLVFVSLHEPVCLSGSEIKLNVVSLNSIQCDCCEQNIFMKLAYMKNVFTDFLQFAATYLHYVGVCLGYQCLRFEECVPQRKVCQDVNVISVLKFVILYVTVLYINIRVLLPNIQWVLNVYARKAGSWMTLTTGMIRGFE